MKTAEHWASTYKFHVKPRLENRFALAAAQAASEEYEQHKDAMWSKGKAAVMVEMRMLCWFVLKVATNCSCTDVGKAFGYDHGAVLHAWKKAIVWLRVYPQVRQRYDRIAAKFCELTK